MADSMPTQPMLASEPTKWDATLVAGCVPDRGNYVASHGLPTKKEMDEMAAAICGPHEVLYAALLRIVAEYAVGLREYDAFVAWCAKADEGNPIVARDYLEDLDIQFNDENDPTAAECCMSIGDAALWFTATRDIIWDFVATGRPDELIERMKMASRANIVEPGFMNRMPTIERVNQPHVYPVFYRLLREELAMRMVANNV